MRPAFERQNSSWRMNKLARHVHIIKIWDLWSCQLHSNGWNPTQRLIWYAETACVCGSVGTPYTHKQCAQSTNSYRLWRTPTDSPHSKQSDWLRRLQGPVLCRHATPEASRLSSWLLIRPMPCAKKGSPDPSHPTWNINQSKKIDKHNWWGSKVIKVLRWCEGNGLQKLGLSQVLQGQPARSQALQHARPCAVQSWRFQHISEYNAQPNVLLRYA